MAIYACINHHDSGLNESQRNEIDLLGYFEVSLEKLPQVVQSVGGLRCGHFQSFGTFSQKTVPKCHDHSLFFKIEH